MRSLLSTFLVALVSLASLEQCEALDIHNGPQRPQYYFPRRIKREVHRDSPAYVKRNSVIVIPMTVMIGPDGKKTTLGSPVNRLVSLGTQPVTSSETTVPATTTSEGITVSTDPTTLSQPTTPSTVPKAPVETGSSEVPRPSTSVTAIPSSSDISSGGISIGLSDILTGLPVDPTSLLPTPPSNSHRHLFRQPTPALRPTAKLPDSSAPTEGGVTPPPHEPTLKPTPTGTGGILPPILEPSNDSSSTFANPTGGISQTVSSTGLPTTSAPVLPSIIPPIIQPNVTSPSSDETPSRTGMTSSTSVIDITPTFPTLSPPPVTEIPSGTGTGPINTLSNGEIPSTTETSNSSTTPPTGTVTQTVPTETATSSTLSGIFPSDGTATGSGSGIFRPTSATTSSVSSTPTAPSESRTIITMSTITTSPTAGTGVPTQGLSSSSTTSTVSLSTNSETMMSIPTSIVVQPTPTGTETSSATTSPTSRPKIISPPKDNTKIPPNSVAVQLGFNGSLSYDFVVQSTGATTQIFHFLPLGVAYALDIPIDQATVRSLIPYDTATNVGYTTTVAIVYIPSDLVQSLALLLRTPTSRLYNNPDPATRTIMAMLDPTIPLTGGLPNNQVPNNPGQNNPNNPGNGGNNGEPEAGPGPGGSGGNYNVRATSVGIGLGVVGGASLYGAAMFFVARRYRRRRRSQNEESLIGQRAREGEPFMSGARSDGYGSSQRNSGGGTSARTQTISPPVMAENSLGWN
ncbi:predicted protein [Uncinocarpus reesii 1704]|uniref:Uncharacterized protein n=1 Tax=Uncinocarpus reesii (strain UAMH 1704) TaxID=336963 RepID=C4JH81_UNCRE|nr:uncharacterized protein UREG_02654 [Uncinocarpus reesii 1704]EEP77805.1 predicted protein [Uncinocarpus reesii 1704]